MMIIYIILNYLYHIIWDITYNIYRPDIYCTSHTHSSQAIKSFSTQPKPGISCYKNGEKHCLGQPAQRPGGGGAIKSTAAPIILRLKLKMRLDKLRNLFVYFAAAHNMLLLYSKKKNAKSAQISGIRNLSARIFDFARCIQIYRCSEILCIHNILRC